MQSGVMEIAWKLKTWCLISRYLSFVSGFILINGSQLSCEGIITLICKNKHTFKYLTLEIHCPYRIKFNFPVSFCFPLEIHLPLGIFWLGLLWSPEMKPHGFSAASSKELVKHRICKRWNIKQINSTNNPEYNLHYCWCKQW